jgi:catechol 2,3-dioxygenase-like lactoylglutathione lyase family enzyme
MTAISHIARVIVPVADKDRALAFYSQTLGFDVLADVPFGDGDRWVEVGPSGAQTAIAFGPVMRGWVAIPTGISFLVDDVDALHGGLREAGVDVDAEVVQPAPGVPRMFWLRDPDGNTLHVADG